MTTVGLVMMVKNEAERVRAALDSALPIADYVLVTDTGSTDDTKRIVEGWLAEHAMHGEALDVEWEGWAQNRTVLLDRMRERDWIDYVLMLDADERLALDGAWSKDDLVKDYYDIAIVRNECAHHIPRLTSNRCRFSYQGPIHEYIASDVQRSNGKLPWLKIVDCGRSRPHERYRAEAELIEQYLQRPRPPLLEMRYTFYLAQSYRDCSDFKLAIKTYLKRADMGGPSEEVYSALMNAAKLREKLQLPVHGTAELYKRAIATIPFRAEAYHGIARLYRIAERYEDGYQYASRGVGLPLWDGLFVETWIYEYGLIDELALCAYWTDRLTEAWLANELLRRVGPKRIKQRVEGNMTETQIKLANAMQRSL